MIPLHLQPWTDSLPEAMAAVAAAFVAGCVAGSFLNVVAHRVPRGETVVFGRSRCPACGAPVRARDNVPVLGWLLLRGRCRDCREAISPRYPLVEAACGCLAAALAVLDLAACGGDVAAAAVPWGGHCVLALAIVAATLLAAQGHALPTAIVAVAAAVAAGATSGWQAAMLAAAAAIVGRAVGRYPAAAWFAVLPIVFWRPIAWVWEVACR